MFRYPTKKQATQLFLHGTCSTMTPSAGPTTSVQTPKAQMHRFYSSKWHDPPLSLTIRDYVKSMSFSDDQARCSRSVAVIKIWTITVVKFEERNCIIVWEVPPLAWVARGYRVEGAHQTMIKSIHGWQYRRRQAVQEPCHARCGGLSMKQKCGVHQWHKHHILINF